MSVKLVDLQLIYGVAGAREKFENLCSQLVAGEQPDADGVRIKRGDGGIDVHVGDLTEPQGIEIYQCKYFPQGIDDDQKEQIRKSFRTCRDSSDFKLKKWTLCLPVDLSIDEKRWFEEWRNKQQSATEIEIGPAWGSTKLEGLLYQDKNKGLKEEFFKEEYLAQIRHIHGMLTNLLPNIAERLNQDAGERDAKRKQESRAQEDKYVAALLSSSRKVFAALLQQGTDDRPGPIQAPYWECVIRPEHMSESNIFASLAACRAVVSDCQVGPPAASFPDLDHSRDLADVDSIGGWLNLSGFECWRLSQRGVFLKILTTEEASSRPFERSIGLRNMTLRLTQMFRFAAKFSYKASKDGALEIGIRLAGIDNRTLSLGQGLVRQEYRATANELQHTWTYKDWRTPDAMAIAAAFWFCERFNWPYVETDFLSRLQAAAWRDP